LDENGNWNDSSNKLKDALECCEIPYSLKSYQNTKIDLSILQSVDTVIRLYIIDAKFNESADFFSKNDTYMIIKIHDTKVKSKKVVNNSLEPELYESFEFLATFPGPSELKIKFYDKDLFSTDDFVGQCEIDIEQRFFDFQWRSKQNHPIETREILHPSSSTPVGSCRFFLEIQPHDNSLREMVDISPRPPVELELRIIVWEVLGMPLEDIEGTSDLFVKVKFDAFGKSAKTDVHYRSQNGNGYFNWRIVFPITVNEIDFDKIKNDDNDDKKATLSFEVYDRDLFTFNDFICEFKFNIRDLIKQTIQNESYNTITNKKNVLDKLASENRTKRNKRKSKKKSQHHYYSFELDEQNVHDSYQTALTRKIRLSVDCLTKEIAEKIPVGIGRSEPNQEPVLNSPKGRIFFSWNPITMLEQMIGPRVRRKLCMYICLLFFIIILILLLPMIVSNIVSLLVGKIFGL
jgi:hypothetical protein